MVYYNDPFADEDAINVFSNSNNFSFEAFKNNYKV